MTDTKNRATGDDPSLAASAGEIAARIAPVTDFGFYAGDVAPAAEPVLPSYIDPHKQYTQQQLDQMLDTAINLHVAGHVERAMQVYHEVLWHDRGNKRALYFAAVALSQKNQPEEKVLQIMEHAVRESPNIPEGHYNLGILYHRQGRVDDAIASLEKAVEMSSRLVEARTSLGGCWLNKGEKEKGRYWLEKAARMDSPSKDSIYSRAFAKLTLGDMLTGWTDYDNRWKTASFLVENRRNFGNARHWNGKPIPGHVLYVHTEQGAGDVIMFSRFLRQVAERSQARTIVFEVGANLVTHMAQVPGVDYVIATNTPVPAEVPRVTRYLPLMGMMRQVGILKDDRITDRDGWLRAVVPPRPEAKALLDAARAAGRLRVGVVWAGSKAHKNDLYRSIGWRKMRDLLLDDPRLAGAVTFFSLQVGEYARQMDDRPVSGEVAPVVDLTPHVGNFEDTAALCAELDLLIAVDTSTVHVAASLVGGPPVWMLTPAAPDWRWRLDGDTTPWYSRVSVIRQQRWDDWVTPLRYVADRLAGLASSIDVG